MIEVDVLVRTNGEGLYLREALDSVLGQTMLPLIKCHVSVFNPSLGLIETLRNYTGNPVFCFHWISQAGYAYPLNKMVACAKGEFIALLDHDDVMNAQRIEIQLDYMKHNPNIGAIGSSINLIDSDSRIIGEKLYATDPSLISRNITKTTPIANPSCMIRKDLILKIGGYREFYDTAEDYDLWLRLSEISEFSNLTEKLTNYRIHENQVTSKERFRNLAASKSALKSRANRIAGRKEVHEKWKSAIFWASQPHIRLLLHYEILFEQTLRFSIFLLVRGKRVQALVYLLVAALLNPFRTTATIKARIRRGGIEVFTDFFR